MYLGMKCKWSKFAVRTTLGIVLLCSVTQGVLALSYKELAPFLAMEFILIGMGTLAILIAKMMDIRHLHMLSKIYGRHVYKCDC